MSTLEDKILKQNVPGQWSAMDETDDLRQEDNGDLSDFDEQVLTPQDEKAAKTMVETDRLLNHSLIPDSVKAGILGERARKKGTGVKGVLADYRLEQSLKQAEREAKEAEREAVLHRMAYGVTVPATEGGNLNAIAPQLGSDSDLDDEDAQFMEQFRAARLRELQGQHASPPQPQYKDVDTIFSSEDLLEEVANSDPRTTLVVHMFEASVSACILLNRILEELATRWTEVRFLRIQASNTNLLIDRVALPALSIYRNGDLITVLAGLVEELGDRFSREDVEWLLESTEGWKG